MVRAPSFNACLAATSQRAHGSPPLAASPHSRGPPRCARSVQHSPQECAVLDCHRHVPPSARTPLHGPCRRGPASRLPCATRRRGPSPHLRAGPLVLLRLARERFTHPRPPLPATCFTRVPSAPSAVTAALPPHRPRAVARHPSRLRSLTLPPRFVCRYPPASLTARGLRRHRPARAVYLAALVVGTPLHIRVPGAGFARHRLPHPAVLDVRTTANATVGASGNVLRTPALSSVRSPLHSVAVAAPFRRLRRRRSPLASTLGSVVPHRVSRLWFSHPTQPAAGARPAHLWPTPVCAPAAFRCPALVGPSGCSV